MAVAQADPQTGEGVDVDGTEEGKSGRRSKSQAGADGRVDAASLDPSELTSIMFNLPAGLRVLVQEDGKARGISVAAVMRIVTAEHYNYDLPVTLRQSTARRKYATPEDALAAKKAKADELRRVHRAFMEAYARGEQGAVEIMERANAGS